MTQQTEKTKTIFFGFFPFDYKAMVPYLEEMAKKGWELKSFDRFTATFRAVKPRDSICYVDVFTGGEDAVDGEKQRRDYLKQWSKRGMKLAAQYDFFYYFYNSVSDPDLPEEVNVEEEYNLLSKAPWRKEWLSMIVLVGVMLISGFIFAQMSVTRLYSFTGFASLIMFPIAIIPFLCVAGCLLPWVFRVRRLGKVGLPLPTPTLKEARRRYRLFYSLIVLVLAIAVVAVIADAVLSYPFPIKLGGLVLGISFIFLAVVRILKKISTVKGQLPAFCFAVGMFVLSVCGNAAFEAGFGTQYKLPENVAALQFSDLDNVKEEPVSFSYKPTMSPVIPTRYSYVEALSDGTQIACEYYDTVSDTVADLVYNKLVKAIGKSRTLTPLNKELYGIPGYQVDSENAVLLKWDNKILFAELTDKTGAITGLDVAIWTKFLQ